jgi:HEAT repeats
MTRRRKRLLLLLAAAAVLTVLALPAVRWPLLGWWRGEAFFKYRPTSYWSAAFAAWATDRDRVVAQSSAWGRRYYRTHDPLTGLKGLFGLGGAYDPFVDSEIPSFGPAGIPVLIALLSDADPRVRDSAAVLLGAFGPWPETRAAVPALRRLLSDDAEVVPGSGYTVGKAAARALRRIDPAALEGEAP